jgi:hypothetical protein
MQKAITDLRHAETKAFNQAVAKRYEKAGIIVRTNVEKVGKVKIARSAGQLLGDIDVLVVDPSRRTISLIETKDLGLARTPLEMGQQLRDIFIGDADDRCDVDKHIERMAWVQGHRHEVLEFLRVKSSEPNAWRVDAMLVTDEPVMTPYVTEPKLPVVAFRDLG